MNGEHPRDEEFVVPAVVSGILFALQRDQHVGKEWGTELSVGRRYVVPFAGSCARKAIRQMALLFAEYVYGVPTA